MTAGLAASVLGIVALGGSGWVWMSRDRALRLAATARNVNDKLDQARALTGQARAAAVEDLTKWSQAYDAAKQAEGYLATGEADAALSDRVATLLSSLSRDQKEAEAKAAEARRDRQLVERLEEIRAHRGDAFDPVDNDPEYTAAFREYGIEVETIPAADAGRRIAARPKAFAVEVAAALDNWALDRRSRRQPSDRWHRPMTVARAADPDPWRDRLRDLLLATNREELQSTPKGPRGANLHDRSRGLLLRPGRAGLLALNGTIDLRSLNWYTAYLLTIALRDPWNQVPSLSTGAGTRTTPPVPVVGQEPGLPPTPFTYGLSFYETLTGTSDPESLDRHSAYLLAIGLRDTGHEEDAIRVLRVAQGRYPGDLWINYTLAETLSRQRPTRWDEVVRFYTVVRAIRPELSHALGHALEEAGFVDERLAVFQDLVRLRPSNSRHHYCLGKALSSKGRLDGAIAAYHTAIRLQPDLAEAHAELGNALRGQEKLDEAIAECRAAIRLKPDLAGAHSALARAMALPPDRPLREYEEGLVHARKGVELAPTNGNSFNTLALVEYRLGRWAESLAASERSMELQKGGHAGDWFLLAMARWQKGDKDETRKWFDKAVAWTREKDPKNAELRQFWAEAAELLGQPGPNAPGAESPVTPAAGIP